MKIFPGLGLFFSHLIFSCNTIFLSKTIGFSMQNNNIPLGLIPVLEQEEKEPVSATHVTEDSTRNLVPNQETERDIGQTRSRTDYFKANRKKKPKKTGPRLSEEEKQSIVKQTQIDARVAMIDNSVENKEKLDRIFVEVVSKYKNQDPETFYNIFNSVFNIVYFQNKQLHEILKLGEVLEMLEILKSHNLLITHF
ncbi:MAG: hypothetical protein ACR5KV_04460 [Wolbachia sp.]